jgi:hypothetical protein
MRPLLFRTIDNLAVMISRPRTEGEASLSTGSRSV